MAAVLTNLCTYEGVLPQGAVTSPYIANLVCYNLDSRLSGLCGQRDIVYTRYADDLSFSSNVRSELNKIEKLVKHIVEDEGFLINESKTRYSSNVVKKCITGITINNSEIHVDKQLKKKVRAMIFNSILNQDYRNNERIKGMIAYIDSIEPGYKNKIVEYINKLKNKEVFNSNNSIVAAFNANKIFGEVSNWDM